MGQPYSMDLRDPVVAAVQQEGLSRREAAARFGVAESTAIHWPKRMETMGSVAPSKLGGYRPKKIVNRRTRGQLLFKRVAAPCPAVSQRNRIEFRTKSTICALRSRTALFSASLRLKMRLSVWMLAK